mgnify:CR=1 FL=1
MPNQARAPLRIAVCDDEALDRAQIAQMAQEILRAEEIPAEIACFASARALLHAIQTGGAFQILLLDVMMEGMDGMELAAALRAGQEEAAIVFISSNREMALRGYEVAAARYLAKPLDAEKLREALLHCCAAYLQPREIVLPTSEGQSKVNVRAIVYVEPWDRGVRLHFAHKKVEVRMSISQVAALLPEHQFAYCHRTLLVNLAYVRHLRYCELELKSGERLPISKYRLAQFKSEFMKYLKA